jgi:hypothetical protein
MGAAIAGASTCGIELAILITLLLPTAIDRANALTCGFT